MKRTTKTKKTTTKKTTKTKTTGTIAKPIPLTSLPDFIEKIKKEGKDIQLVIL